MKQPVFVVDKNAAIGIIHDWIAEGHSYTWRHNPDWVIAGINALTPEYLPNCVQITRIATIFDDAKISNLAWGVFGNAGISRLLHQINEKRIRVETNASDLYGQVITRVTEEVQVQPQDQSLPSSS